MDYYKNLTRPQLNLLSEINRSGTDGVKLHGPTIQVARNLAKRGLCRVTGYPHGLIMADKCRPGTQEKQVYTCEPTWEPASKAGCPFWEGCEQSSKEGITIPLNCPLRPTKRGPLTISIDDGAL